MQTSRRAAALAVGIGVVVACNGPPPSTPAPTAVPYSTPSSVAWTDCGGGFQCGTVSVPLDYVHPSQGTIKIALVRKAATDPSKRIGSLLLNPGGPGGSGIAFARNSARLLASLNTRFDLVGFDPRGVGQSAPVQCLTGPQKDAFFAVDPVVDDPQEKQALIESIKAFARSCQQKSGKILPFVDSGSAARDMDVLRAALETTHLLRRRLRHWLATIAKNHGLASAPARNVARCFQALKAASRTASSASARSRSIPKARR